VEPNHPHKWYHYSVENTIVNNDGKRHQPVVSVSELLIDYELPADLLFFNIFVCFVFFFEDLF